MNHVTKTLTKAAIFLFFFFALAIVPASVKAAGFTIEWDANTETDLSGYRLFRAGSSLLSMTTAQAMSSGTVLKSVQSSTSTFLPLTELAPSTSYYFRLTAYDAASNQSLFNVNGSNQATEVVVYFTPAQAADINGDGTVNITDLSIFLNRWGTNNAVADLNSQGSVEITDLSILLNNWTRA